MIRLASCVTSNDFCFSWNLQDQRLRIPHSLEKKDPEFYVFKMIDGLMIEKFDVSKASEELTLQHLLQLMRGEREFDLSQLVEPDVCPICPEQVLLTTPRDVWYHRRTSSHRNRLARLD